MLFQPDKPCHQTSLSMVWYTHDKEAVHVAAT